MRSLSWEGRGIGGSGRPVETIVSKTPSRLSERLKVRGALCIMRGMSGVLSAINLDDQASRLTAEVDDIGSDWRLTAKF